MITTETFKSDTAYVKRSQNVDAVLSEFMDQKIVAILKHRGLEHPFLNRYAKHGLPLEKSKLLYLETLHYFKYLPFYVCGISTITRDENVLRSIAFNARDELGVTKSHSDIYHEFLIHRGISENEIQDYKCLPSTTALNDGIRSLYCTPPIQKAMGALFADEAMSAGMVAKYNSGLVAEGVSKKERGFWTLHMEVEVGHSNAVFNIMEKHLQTEENRKLFSSGIEQYMHLMEMYWNGIEDLIDDGKN
jgi:pyrroloquinoline-quinone synthase